MFVSRAELSCRCLLIASTLTMAGSIFGQAPGSDVPAPQQPAATAPDQAPPRRPAQRQQQQQRRPGANVPVPDSIELVRDVVYATAPDKDGKPVELKMDCAFLKQSDGKPMPVVMYIHGGGWSNGDRAMGVPFCIAFAQGGYFAVTVSYRLSGQAIFPAQVHDVKAAVRFIRANAERLAIDPDRIGVWGHSAGGHLSAMLGTAADVEELEGEIGEKNGSSAVQAVVDISGPTDLVRIAPGGNGGPMVSAFLGGTVREKQDVARAASPVTHVTAGDAPTLIIQGGNDRLIVDEQAEILRDALQKAGVEVEYLYIEEAPHGVPDRRALHATAAFFDKHLGGKSVDALAELARRFPNLAGRAASGEEAAGAPDRRRRGAAGNPPAGNPPATQPDG